MKKLCLLLALIVLLPFADVKAKEYPDVTAHSYAVLEQNTGMILCAKNAHEKLPMASTTKVMTAILAIESGRLDDTVTVCDESYGVEGSSIYLLKNERIKLIDLAYGLMLRSGNDAAVAIACYVGGDVTSFVDMMNEKAAEIGAVNTHFDNPNGLPSDNHYTTAYDLALICRYAMMNDTFREIVSAQYYTAQSGEVTRTMMNKNKLLFQYEGATGIKTGYTKAAGKCLTFSAVRDGMAVVGAELNSPDMFPDSMKLMDWCYDEYRLYTVIKSGTRVMRVSLQNSDRLSVLVTQNDVSIPVKKSEGIKLRTSIKLSENISAPQKKGTQVGTLFLYKDDKLISSVPLVTDEDVKGYDFIYRLRQAAMFFTA